MSSPARFQAGRRLAAILAADVVGFSAAMTTDAEATVTQVKWLQRAVIEPQLAEAHGRLFKIAGDGFLAEFGSAAHAVRCAFAIQAVLTASDAALRLRIGVHLGDVLIQDDGDVFGDGVNIASRLEQIAMPGGICISDLIHDQMEKAFAGCFKDAGERQLKNIARPVRVYAWPEVGQSVGSDPRASARPSVAVLPFSNLSSDDEQDYFADGIAEEIINCLSHVKWLIVIGRSSSFTYKGRTTDSRVVGRELGVRYVLGGSTRKAAGRVRVAAQLTDASNGRSVWAQHFDGTLEDIFSFQDQITERIVAAIEPAIRKIETEYAKLRPTDDVRSYDLYLRGPEQFHGASSAHYARAVTLFRAAVERDENFADAWTALANCLTRRAYDGFDDDPEDALKEGLAAAEKAVAIELDNGWVLAQSSWILALIGGRFQYGLDLAERAAELMPNSSIVLNGVGWTLLANGDLSGALQALRKSVRLDPIGPRVNVARCAIAAVHFFEGQYAESIAITERIVQEAPGLKTAMRLLAAAHARDGNLAMAQSVMRDLVAAQPAITVALVKKFWRFRDPQMAERYHGGLLLAGMAAG